MSARKVSETPSPDPSRENAERPGPSDAHSPLVWTELRRAAIWVSVVGIAALCVLLIQPLLFITASIVIAVMLDGGTRLLGRVLPIARGWRLAIVIFAVIGFLGWTVYLTGSQLAQQAAALPDLIQAQVNRFSDWMSSHGVNLGIAESTFCGKSDHGFIGASHRSAEHRGRHPVQHRHDAGARDLPRDRAATLRPRPGLVCAFGQTG